MDIEQICAAVAKWASEEPLISKAYVFGSRLKGTATACSDLDIAVELRKLQGDETVFATWIGEAAKLRESIKPLFPYSIDLQHHNGLETPHVHSYLNECSRVVYESPA